MGKWNAGSKSWGNLPINRGFDSSYGYMSGEEDHYTQKGGYKGGIDLWEDSGPAYGKNGTYNAFTFTQHSVDIITKPLPALDHWRCCQELGLGLFDDGPPLGAGYALAPRRDP